MRDELKNSLEEITNSSITQLKNSKSFFPKRIILMTSLPILNQILVFNYTENCFLNKQYILDNKIKTLICPNYIPRFDKLEGDWPVDLGALLENKPVNLSSYTDY